MNSIRIGSVENNKWNFAYLLVIFIVAFTLITFNLINLQVTEAQGLSLASSGNELNRVYIYPNRGVIYDREGNVLAENVLSTDLFLKIEAEDEDIKSEFKALTDTFVSKGLLDTSEIEELEGEFFDNVGYIEENNVFYSGEAFVEVLTGLDNDETITAKVIAAEVDNLYVVESNSRYYPEAKDVAHILGYVGGVNADNLSSLDYLDYKDGKVTALHGYEDIVGQIGIEAYYDEELVGDKGISAIEGQFIDDLDDNQRVIQSVANGKDLVISIDLEAQQKMNEVIAKYVEQQGATGGAGILMDVETGEILSYSSVPTYDSNKFVGGISQAEYDALIEDEQNPLLNRGIGAQLPPGSTFKTLALAGGYDAGQIEKDTEYLSSNDYTFNNGRPFQEFRNKEYGWLNPYQAIGKSSNIYFCEVIRNWDIYEMVDYYESFGIGENTGVDLVGELPGRLPSPENKEELAKDPNVTWLEPIWYPEGDGCNTVIGQGITLTTPIQMVRWTGAIANDGELLTPHFVKQIGADEVEFDNEKLEFQRDDTLEVVRDAMLEAVSGEYSSIASLDGTKLQVAAKTGTAEFGALNADGQYEHTHAWVTGFYPYEEPKYAFVILLEDGGQSTYSANAAREFIDWYIDNRLLESEN